MAAYYFRVIRTPAEPVDQTGYPRRYEMRKTISYMRVDRATLGEAYDEAKKKARTLDGQCFLSSVYVCTEKEYLKVRDERLSLKTRDEKT